MSQIENLMFKGNQMTKTAFLLGFKNQVENVSDSECGCGSDCSCDTDCSCGSDCGCDSSCGCGCDTQKTKLKL